MATGGVSDERMATLEGGDEYLHIKARKSLVQFSVLN